MHNIDVVLNAIERRVDHNRYVDFLRLLKSLIHIPVNETNMSRIVQLHKNLLPICAEEGKFFELFRFMAALMKSKESKLYRRQWLNDFTQFPMTQTFVERFKNQLIGSTWVEDVSSIFRNSEYECLDLLPDYMIQMGDVYALQGKVEDACLHYRMGLIEEVTSVVQYEKILKRCEKVIKESILQWRNENTDLYKSYFIKTITQGRNSIFTAFKQSDPMATMKALERLHRFYYSIVPHEDSSFVKAILGTYLNKSILRTEDLEDKIFQAWRSLWLALIKELSTEVINSAKLEKTVRLLEGLSILCEWMGDVLLDTGTFTVEQTQEYFHHIAECITGKLTYVQSLQNGSEAQQFLNWVDTDTIENQLNIHWPSRNEILKRLAEKGIRYQARLHQSQDQLKNQPKILDSNTFLSQLNEILGNPYKLDTWLSPAALLEDSQNELKILAKKMKSLTEPLSVANLSEESSNAFIQARELWIKDAKQLVSFLWQQALTWVGLPPPCAYSFGLLGSFARGEAALCSDIECLILLGADETGKFTGEPQSPEEFKSALEHAEILPYFRLAFQLFQNAVILLGESDVLEDIIHKRGLRLDDRYHPFRRAENDIFIGTLENMPSVFQEDLNKADIMPLSICYDACLLEGDENLMKAYLDKRSSVLSTTIDPNGMLQRHKMAFKYWAERAGRESGKEPREWLEMPMITIKNQALSILSGTIKALSIYYGIDAMNTYERVDALRNVNKLDENTAEGLKVAIAWIDQLRCCCHEYYDTEEDTLYLWDINPKDFYSLGLENIHAWQKLMGIYHDVIQPLWHTMTAWINHQKNSSSQEEVKPFELNSPAFTAWNQARQEERLHERAMQIMEDILIECHRFSEKMTRWWPRWLRLLSQLPSEEKLKWSESLYSRLEIPERIVFLEAWKSLNSNQDNVFKECIPEEIQNLLQIKSQMVKNLANIPSSDGWSGMMYLKEKNWREGVSTLFAESLEESAVAAKVEADAIVIGCRNPNLPVNYSGYEIIDDSINPRGDCGLFLLSEDVKKNLMAAEKKAFELAANDSEGKRHIILPFQHKTKDNTLYRFCLKIFPENPGMEYAINQLQYLLGGNEIPDVWLWRIYSKSYPQGIAAILMEDVRGFSLSESDSKTIKSFQEAFCDKQSFENISRASFTRHFLRVLLTLPEDDKPNDYFLVPQELKGDYHQDETGFALARVDNERSFYLGEIFSPDTTDANRADIRQRQLQIKTAIFCMNNMENPLDEVVLKRFFQNLNVTDLCENWLSLLMDWNENASIIFKNAPGIEARLSPESRKLAEKNPSVALSLWHYENSGDNRSRYHIGIFDNTISNPLSMDEKDNFCLTVMPFPEDRAFNFVSTWESIYHYCSDMGARKLLPSITGMDILKNVHGNLYRHYYDNLPAEGNVSSNHVLDPRVLFWRFDQVTYQYYKQSFWKGWSLKSFKNAKRELLERPLYKTDLASFQLWLKGVDAGTPQRIEEILTLVSTKPSASTFGKLMSLASGKNYTREDYVGVILKKKVGNREPETPGGALHSIMSGRIADYLCWDFIWKTLSRDILEDVELNNAYAFFYNLPLLQQQKIVERFLKGEEYNESGLPLLLQKRLVNLLLGWIAPTRGARLYKLDLQRLKDFLTKKTLIKILQCFQKEVKQLKLCVLFNLLDQEIINAINACEQLITLTLDGAGIALHRNWQFTGITLPIVPIPIIAKKPLKLFHASLIFVRELEISNHAILEEIILMAPNLEKLTLSHNPALTDCSFDYWNTPSGRQDPSNWLLKEPSLTHLNIMSCDSMNESSILKMTQKDSLTHFTVSNKPFSMATLIKVLKGINPEYFEKLILGEQHINVLVTQMLIKILRKSTTLKCLEINGINYISLRESFRVFFNKTHCNLSHKTLADQDILVIAALLPQYPQLRLLNLSNIELSEKSMVLLCSSIQQSKYMEILDLHSCNLTDRAVEMLVNLFEKNNMLKWINVDLNPLSEETKESLYKLMSERVKETQDYSSLYEYLETVRADENGLLSDDQEPEDFAESSTSSDYPTNSTKKLSRLVEEAILKNIEEKLNHPICDFSGLTLNAMEMDCIISLLPGNEKIKTLNFSGNRLTRKFIEMLCLCLEDNTHLEMLDLRYCDVQDAKPLFTLLERNKTIQWINVDVNPITEETTQALVNLMLQRLRNSLENFHHVSSALNSRLRKSALFWRTIEALATDTRNIKSSYFWKERGFLNWVDMIAASYVSETADINLSQKTSCFFTKEEHPLINWKNLTLALYENEGLKIIDWEKRPENKRKCVTFLENGKLPQSINTFDISFRVAFNENFSLYKNERTILVALSKGKISSPELQDSLKSLKNVVTIILKHCYAEIDAGVTMRSNINEEHCSMTIECDKEETAFHLYSFLHAFLYPLNVLKQLAEVSLSALHENLNQPLCDFSDRGLSHLEISIIASSLRNNSKLKILNLSANPFSEENTQLLLQSLEGNTTLEVLDLHGCGLKAPLAKDLITLLEKNKTLKLINLDLNSINSQTKNVLYEIFMDRCKSSSDKKWLYSYLETIVQDTQETMDFVSETKHVLFNWINMALFLYTNETTKEIKWWDSNQQGKNDNPTLYPFTVEHHSKKINGLIQLENSNLVSYSDDSIRVWNVTSGERSLTFNASATRVIAHHGFLASTNNFHIELLDLDENKGCQWTIKGNLYPIKALVAVDARLAVGGDNDGSIKILFDDPKTLKEKSKSKDYLIKEYKTLDTYEHTPAGNYDKAIKRAKIGEGACYQILEGHSMPVNALTKLRDGRLASGSEDRTIKLWDIKHGVCTLTLEGSTNSVDVLLQLKDGRLASGGTGHIRIWDIKTGALVLTIPTGTSALTQLHDGRLVSQGISITFWDVNTGNCLAKVNEYGTSSLIQLKDGRLAGAFYPPFFSMRRNDSSCPQDNSIKILEMPKQALSVVNVSFRKAMGEKFILELKEEMIHIALVSGISVSQEMLTILKSLKTFVDILVQRCYTKNNAYYSIQRNLAEELCVLTINCDDEEITFYLYSCLEAFFYPMNSIKQLAHVIGSRPSGVLDDEQVVECNNSASENTSFPQRGQRKPRHSGQTVFFANTSVSRPKTQKTKEKGKEPMVEELMEEPQNLRPDTGRSSPSCSH